MLASKNGHIETVSALVEAGADLEYTTTEVIEFVTLVYSQRSNTCIIRYNYCVVIIMLNPYLYYLSFYLSTGQDTLL